ncbi:MAG: VirB6/TrbL-like conjugal transfer protein, CD1112 family, partial [Faecalibacterium sp.]
NMAQFEPALICKWIFKTAISVWLISNTFDIVMGVFDLTQEVVASSSGIIAGNTRVNDAGLVMLESSMMSMEVGQLFGLFLQSFFIGITMRILGIVIFVIVYGRMVEIYMAVSLAPIPFSTFGNHEQSHMGQNYLRSLFALGFQGFLILVCVAIYAVLIQNISISGDAVSSIWSIVGYTVLLCFTLFKTSSVARSVLNAH